MSAQLALLETKLALHLRRCAPCRNAAAKHLYCRAGLALVARIFNASHRAPAKGAL